MVLTKVMAVVRGNVADDGVISQAAEAVRTSHGKLYVVYVIKMDRSLPVDADVPSEVTRAEAALSRAERTAHLPRGDVEAHIVQARDIGVAVVHEAAVREVDAIVVGTPYPFEYSGFRLSGELMYVLRHAPCDVVLWRERPGGPAPMTAAARNGRSRAAN